MTQPQKVQTSAATTAPTQPATVANDSTAAIIWRGQVLARTNSREIRELQAARRAAREAGRE